MGFDDGIAHLIRGDLADCDIVEQRMFGGLCFMWRGNMLCGTFGDGAMYRVGKTRQAEALALDDVTPMEMAGRRMSGFVVAGPDLLADEARRAHLLGMARDFVATLPAK